MIFEHTNCRNFLKAALADRIAENSSYSLRAFAQNLGFANSYLSEVLSGKKKLSTDAVLKISIRLNLTELETQYFCLLSQLESQTDPDFKMQIQEKLTNLRPDRKIFDLSSDVFRIIADWYHFGILELTRLKGFRLGPKTVSAKFGISAQEAEVAIERLMRLELLEKTPDGNYRKTKDYVLAQSNIPNSAMKRFHKQLMQKAIEAVDTQTPDHRYSSTDILPIDKKNLPQVRQILDECSSAVLKLTSKSKVKDQVACLSLQFFELSKSQEKL